MTDKIKTEYKKYADEIKPSEEFAGRLTQTLKDGADKKKHIKFRYFKQTAAAAACLIVALTAALAFGRGFHFGPASGTDGEQMTTGIGDMLGNVNTDTLHTGAFAYADWYDESLSAESLPLALAARLESSLDYLAYNDENKFVGADRADKELVEEVIDFLKAARETDGDISGDRVYYMAVFSDGAVAKFCVTDRGFVEISGDGKIYKKNGD